MERELWWIFDSKPDLRGTDSDGLSVWRTRSRAEVDELMRVRVHEMKRKIDAKHAAYTPEQIEGMGLRVDETPSNARPAANGIEHGSLRPPETPRYDPSLPRDAPGNQLSTQEMATIRARYEGVEPTVPLLKPNALKC